MERGLTEGKKGELCGGGQKGKNWENCNRINNKKKKMMSHKGLLYQ